MEKVNDKKRFYIYNSNTKERLRIGSKSDLIKFVAGMFCYTLKDCDASFVKLNEMCLYIYHLDMNEFDELYNERNVFHLQNLSGNDVSPKYFHIYGGKKIVPFSTIDILSFYYREKYVLNPYIFYRGESVFDIRLIKDEVRVYLNQVSYKPTELLINKMKAEIDRKNKYYVKSHTNRKNSTGWKSKKYKKQWMHNLDYKKKDNLSPRKYWKEHYENVFLTEI